MSINVTKKDNSAALAKALKAVTNMDVLVGVPANNTNRNTDEVNNAQLLAIHTAGSPLHGLPARPVIKPAITAKGNKEQLSEQLGIAARLVMLGKAQEAVLQLKRTGMLAEGIVKNWFTDPRNNWSPNSPRTVAIKEAKMTKESKAAAIAAGNPLTRPLIDTGQLRKSITFVVRGKKHD